ncbi:hypothetical protein CDN99_24855 [Roseateles aquatilis]|uniref:Mitomycin resistance protein n=1 Tax=Roseateles aquatilis TaxID=431061 RepID=A0A246IV65_9BURK|nr:helix-hairpin-helix domain-containing protein [Roseateles aquatilis]OWQ84112.1 hypothetical protein CDN99_24855 [Roseateles aquatilis]
MPKSSTGTALWPAAKAATKAASAEDCQQLRQIPNVGPAMVKDFGLLGIRTPDDLVGADAFALYQRLCTLTMQRHDPCVLDTFMAAVDFMNGAAPRDWWRYTPQRKAQYPGI